MKTALVLLASKHLIPNLQSIMHFRESLHKVFIYHTEDSEESFLPAETLQKLCEQELKIACEISGEKGKTSGTPESVARKIKTWINENTDVDEWILNTSGGTRRMQLGMNSFAGNKKVTVIYYEITTGWQEVVRSQDNLTVNPFLIKKACLDKIPVANLVAMQAATSTEYISEDTKYQKIQIIEFTQQCLKNKWNWAESYKPYEEDCKKTGAGFIFEKYIAAILYNGGIVNTANNLIQKKGNEEIDIVALHNSKIAIIDCKLVDKDMIKERKADTFVRQVRSAIATKSRFGSPCVRYIMLRPSLDLPETEKELAKSSQLIVYNGENFMQKFIRETFAYFDQRPKEPVQNIMKLLQNNS